MYIFERGLGLGSSTWDLVMLWLAEDALKAELAILACLPVRVVSQKSACAYMVYAIVWGKAGKFTGGFV